jgi:hypothetical protein
VVELSDDDDDDDVFVVKKKPAAKKASSLTLNGGNDNDAIEASARESQSTPKRAVRAAATKKCVLYLIPALERSTWLNEMDCPARAGRNM